jgi:hypothetical protein
VEYTCESCGHTGIAGPLHGNESCYVCTECGETFCVKCITYRKTGDTLAHGAGSVPWSKPFCYDCAESLENGSEDYG